MMTKISRIEPLKNQNPHQQPAERNRHRERNTGPSFEQALRDALEKGDTHDKSAQEGRRQE